MTVFCLLQCGREGCVWCVYFMCDCLHWMSRSESCVCMRACMYVCVCVCSFPVVFRMCPCGLSAEVSSRWTMSQAFPLCMAERVCVCVCVCVCVLFLFCFVLIWTPQRQVSRDFLLRGESRLASEDLKCVCVCVCVCCGFMSLANFLLAVLLDSCRSLYFH